MLLRFSPGLKAPQFLCGDTGRNARSSTKSAKAHPVLAGKAGQQSTAGAWKGINKAGGCLRSEMHLRKGYG